MGNTVAGPCPGGEDTTGAYLDEPETVRIVLVRPGPYTECFAPRECVRRSAPGGVLCSAAADCTVATEAMKGGESQPLELRSGETFFLLEGQHSAGAAALRFGLGDRVCCKISGTTWRDGTVVGLWYHEQGWAHLAPYQVRLDGAHDERIFVPLDVDELARESTDEAAASAGGWGLLCGTKAVQWCPAAGEAVRYTGGGRFGGDAQVLPDWVLRAGARGTVLQYHGQERPRGIWPVDVAFSRGDGEGAVAVPLTLCDIERDVPPAASGNIEQAPRASRS
eukprot:TRINITY_DN55144_c0_g1_i1.p1 TRINITY_DN55144_c0_g1~~TRINITY_DN55144_c0_g1_i1.p1  ORF type:complete len:301 (+),score=90.30 TRINITY_DN55144_c0_g1_i1:69-905(+)